MCWNSIFNGPAQHNDVPYGTQDSGEHSHTTAGRVLWKICKGVMPTCLPWCGSPSVGDTVIRSMYACEKTDVLNSMSKVSLRVANRTGVGEVHDGDFAQCARGSSK